MSNRWAILIFGITLLIGATPIARRMMRALARAVTRARWAGILAVFILAMLVGAVPLCFRGQPIPYFHDEFVYLLAADTYASGRLTNRPHELWPHFETIHVLSQPTYMAKYPPAQGLTLAAGKLVGMPILGVLVTVALACAAVAWALRAWMPWRWANFGGLLCAFHPLVFWWSQTYFGGGVSLLGGALLAGALGRAMHRDRIAWGIIAGIAAGILANSRPLEGLMLTVILGVFVLVRAILRRTVASLLLRTVAPAMAVLVPIFAWMLYYNWRVTQDPFTMPYALHARQYMVSPIFWWQDPPPGPAEGYRTPKLKEYYTYWERRGYDEQLGGPRVFLREAWGKLVKLRRSYFVPVTLAIPLLALPLVMLRGPRARAARWLAALCLLFPIAHIFITPWLLSYYMSPILVALFAILALCTWSIARRWPRAGSAIALAVAVTQLVAVIVMIRQTVTNPSPPGAGRDYIVQNLKTIPGDHLVFVRYGNGPQELFEWVFNAADIDASRIIWARELDDADSNTRLFERYPNRHVWLLAVDGTRIRFERVR